METVRTRASESIVFGLKSTKKSTKVVKKRWRICSGRRSRKFESCHLDHKESTALVAVLSLCLCVAGRRNGAAAGGQAGRTPCAMRWRREPPRRFFLQSAMRVWKSAQRFVNGYLSPRPYLTHTNLYGLDWGYGDKLVQAALALPTQVTSDQNRRFNRTSDFLLFPR